MSRACNGVWLMSIRGSDDLASSNIEVIIIAASKRSRIIWIYCGEYDIPPLQNDGIFYAVYLSIDLRHTAMCMRAMCGWLSRSSNFYRLFIWHIQTLGRDFGHSARISVIFVSWTHEMASRKAFDCQLKAAWSERWMLWSDDRIRVKNCRRNVNGRTLRRFSLTKVY